MVFSQFLVLPVVPFITKFNRYIVLGLLVVGKFGNNFKAIPDGFSKEKGNYIYKDRNGISQLELDSNRSIMLGMQVEVECYWGDMVPAYQKVVHYSPNWVTWANKERGLVGVVKYVDV